MSSYLVSKRHNDNMCADFHIRCQEKIGPFSGNKTCCLLYIVLVCRIVLYSIVKCIEVQYVILQCNPVQFSTLQYTTVQYCTDF